MYNITIGQLITIWLFGIFLWLMAFGWILAETGGYNPDFPAIPAILLVFIPFALIFYTIGWRNFRKRKKFSKSQGDMDNLERLRKLFDEKDEVKNDDVEALLGVSDSTAGRYLEELEQEGYIEQVGESGRGVYYRKK